MNTRNLVRFFSLMCALLVAALSDAAGLNISNTPLYVTQPVAPNVIISPVYNTEFNEVSLRSAPWDYINEDCNDNDAEQPCGGTRINTLWQAGAPFYQLNTPGYGWRVTPWPGADVTKINVDGVEKSYVSSDVALYPNDFVVWNGVTQFKPLDYPPGKDGQLLTEEGYPDPAVLNNIDKLNPRSEGKARYSRSDLNFLYFSKKSADAQGYSPWPTLGSWSFDAYASADKAKTPFYHPIVHKDKSGKDLIANMSKDAKHIALRCDPSKVESCSLANRSISKVDDDKIGKYWTYKGGNVWNYSSYTQTDWSDIKEADQIKFAHWFTYWRSADLAARGMMGRLVDALGSNNKALLDKLRLGIFHADANGNTTVKVETQDDEPKLVQALADTIYSQDSVFTTVSPNSNSDEKKRAYTVSVWDPYKTTNYFTTVEPYRDDPRSDKSPVRSCRRNYEIVLTPDYSGLRRDNSNFTVPYSPDAGSYNSDAALSDPYADEYDNTLGDVGAYGWNTDLIGLANDLLPGKINTQTAQHLVRYVIGPSDLGTVFNRPMVSYDDALQHLTKHPASGWSDPLLSEKIGPDVIDELWHMALNSRGYFYGGENVNDALDKLLQSLNDILVNNVSGSSIATSTTSLSAGGLIYQATVESDWKGHLRAYNVQTGVNADEKQVLNVNYDTPVWDLAQQVSAQSWSARNIATFDGSIGVPFRWASISENTRSLLKTNKPVGDASGDAYGASVLEYLRGNGLCEDGSGSTCTLDISYSFRRRNLERNNVRAYSTSNTGGRNVLGDIANSSPWLVAAPIAGPSDVDYPGYNAYRVANKERQKVLYVGANDGMLHAVNASNGNELFAYIPSFVQNDLYTLSRISNDEPHYYFVDGSPFAANINLDGWKTLLAGGANRGGNGYYLLDVTNPTENTENNAGGWVKWEFTHSDDLHYSYNIPVADNLGQARQFVRTKDNGKWALIVGNGYPEAASKQACLFIIYLNGPSGANHTWVQGTDYRKLCAGVGDYSVTGTNDGGIGTNGLSTPTPYDTDGDGKVDVIYAGDLNGNMWRFNVDSTTPEEWGVAYSGAPLFVARNAANVRQPIISPPEIMSLVMGSSAGQLLLFGTGKYITEDDITNTDTQSFYGIWDRGLSGITRANLTAQVLDTPTSVNSVMVRKQTTKSYPVYCSTGVDLATCATATKQLGWYWDMPEPRERLTGKVSLINGMVFFNTFYAAPDTYIDGNGVTQIRLDSNGKPMLDPCKYGGDGWLMGLNAVNGYLEDRFSVFDVNQDGVVDAIKDEKVAGVRVGASMGGTSFAHGLQDTMVGFYSPSNKEQTDKNNKAIIKIDPASKGRVSWFELLD